MAISQTNASYLYRDHIQDPHVKDALDDIASQVAAVRSQGQFGVKGAPNAPNPPGAIAVSVASGIFTARISDKDAAAGTRYVLEWATDPQFLSPISEEIGTTTWQRQLTGQKLYFRVASRFLASQLSPWVYFGSQASPTALQG